MAPQAPQEAVSTYNDGLIAGIYGVETGVPLLEYGAGQPCFAVVDHRHGRRDLMAVQAAVHAPARALPVNALANQRIEDLLLPIAHGRAVVGQGVSACFVIMPKPPGPALWPGLLPPPAGQLWGERDLMECVLRPLAQALAKLQAVAMTHRAVRPNNIFRGRDHYAATLGGAWAAPPAMLQPCVFEPPYSAQCHQAGRGEGAIADDVYSLGVVLIALIGGVLPMAGSDDETIIRRKLEHGSFAALIGNLRLTPGMADLLRLMLAEDPDHRPQPAVLANPSTARARRIATRPAPRAQRPIKIGGLAVWDARNLAYVLSLAPKYAVSLLRSHGMDLWLRRTLGEPLLAARVDEIIKGQADDPIIDPVNADGVLLMRTIALLDPLAPLCWLGLAFFPDGIGPLCAMLTGDALQAPQMDQLQSVIHEEACTLWGEARPTRMDMAMLRLDCRQQRVILRVGGWAGGMLRLAYTLNPLLACRATSVRHDAVLRLHDLLPALDRAAPGAVDFVIDADIAAFVSARYNGRMDSDFTILAQHEDPDIDPPGHRGLAQLRVLVRIGEQYPTRRWPALAAVVLPPAKTALLQWRGRTARLAREEILLQAAVNGDMASMLAVLSDIHARNIDAQDHALMVIELRYIESETELLQATRPRRHAMAQTTGNEIAAGIGLMALAVAAVVTVLT
jgi:hypothetical protein